MGAPPRFVLWCQHRCKSICQPRSDLLKFRGRNPPRDATTKVDQRFQPGGWCPNPACFGNQALLQFSCEVRRDVMKERQMRGQLVAFRRIMLLPLRVKKGEISVPEQRCNDNRSRDGGKH